MGGQEEEEEEEEEGGWGGGGYIGLDSDSGGDTSCTG